VKLLRFLDEREYRRVGCSRLLKADVRVIAASNCELAKLVARGLFRQDLYFRINVLAIHLPPLRERIEDIPSLARHFLRLYSARYLRPTLDFSPGALQILLNYSWPGNVRELKHTIERAVLLARETILSSADIELPETGAPPVNESFRQAKARIVGQ